ncbi:MAG TPA: asparagine synthase (glutamine-hydrolyzing), partial [Opitutaceae bacterium]
MCGIAGVIGTALSPAERSAVVARMVRAMPHRGPDDEGMFADPAGGAALGMRRLAIFDPAHGQQPMTTADGRHTLVFNGAIYNFRALRRELEAAGESFRTACDTEVLLAALARWSEAALPRLRGMFAFAWWDRITRTLRVARDCFGIKPLYFAERGDGVVFASELNALLAGGMVPAEIDPAAAAHYLAYLAVPAPGTIYRGIRNLRPGECATWREGRWEIREYWTFAHARGAGDAAPARSREEFLAGLRHQLEDTIAAHRLADVPVGAFLSGGLDSAAIVGLMARGGGTVKTFSIGFGEAAYSEADEAAETARHLGTMHSASVLTGADLAADIESLVSVLDQPTGDGINTYYASRAARAGGVTVALSGLGGDELFGGYPSFRNVPQ